MTQAQQKGDFVSLTVENIGGISQTSVEFDPGVNILAGRNATNRTSLLRAIMAALGSEDVSLKSDADAGRVELRIGDEIYTRTFSRENGEVRTGGDPYLDDPELADLFAFLLATNDAREAVLTEQDLREIIMRPVDTDAINREIKSLEEEKDSLDDELSELADLRQRLPDLESERSDIIDRIEDKEAELEAKRAKIEEFDAGVEETREEKREVDQLMSDLGDARSDLESLRQELNAQRESLESLRERREELEADAEELPESPEGKIEEIDSEIDRLREQKQAVQSEINTLQRIIQFNEDNLEGTSTDVLDALTDGEDGSPTDELLGDSTVVCWTCGHEVAREDIEETLERLRELRQTKLSRSRDIDEEIDDLQTERISYEEKERQRNQVRERLQQTKERIEDREQAIEELEASREELLERIDELESKVEARQTEQNSEILSLHKEANQLEVELNQLEQQREEVRQQIADIESEIERREELKERREEVSDRLEDLRTRIEQIEMHAVESFNDHMETVLDVLEYDNLERIWIERREREVREGRSKVTRREFSLHIVRESESGTAYEDKISHLSESEREVTGLVFALAGYLVHDVHEKVPFMLVDSVEAIDSERIAKLVDYFEDYPDYFVAALLPEDAQAVERPDNVIREI